MIKSLLITSLLLMFSLFISAQTNQMDVEAKSFNDGIGIGFQLNQFKEDFGMGLQISSPTFFKDILSVKLRANYMFYEHLKLDTVSGETETVWTPYSNVMLGIMGIGGVVNKHLKLYGEGGVVMLFPSSEFSDESSVFGGYGVFGFEFYMDAVNSYFFEMGGIGTGARADKLLYKPIYSNGLMLSVGYRINLK